MITPIRGRKLNCFHCCHHNNLIRNDNPDKGTETLLEVLCADVQVSIRNDNPDKGTETTGTIAMLGLSSLIRNDNPDKGTETM